MDQNKIPKPKKHQRFYEVTRKLNSTQIEQEWQYFKEHSRRFDDNPPAQRYGILVMGADPSWDNFIYASTPAELRLTHLERVAELGMNDGHKLRLWLDHLEQMEGKQRRSKRV